VTDSPYAKPNKATKSSTSPQPSAHLQCQQLTSSAGSSTAGSGKQNQLDSMLGNLQADMSRQGVNTTQKGCCNACDKPIVGQVRLFFLDLHMITFVECDKCPVERL
jgi:paxillin